VNILLSGGTGLNRTHLTRSLLADGHRVWILTRDPGQACLPDGAQAVAWDGRSASGWGDLAGRVEAVVNLAGESLSKWPWTEKQKGRFLSSRVNAGRALSEAISAVSPRPKVLVQASGINHYGASGDLADETTPPGDDFLARLTVEWEASTRPVEELGLRRVVVRLGLVLARDGGLLGRMALPVRLFAGGRLGSGRQAVPWVHVDDVVAAIRFLLENESARGAYNLVAPQQTTNADFYRALAKSLRRPYWFSTPAFLLRLALGEMSVLVVDGRPARPERLRQAGFAFSFPGLEEALETVFSHASAGRSP